MSEAMGIMRRMDDLGRVVIPREIRTMLSIYEGTPMEMHVENGSIILTPYPEGDMIRKTLIKVSEALNDSNIENKDEVLALMKEAERKLR